MNYNYEYNKGLRIDELNSYRAVLSEHLTDTDRELLDEYIEKWNFYEGYHWENIELQDKPQVTKNYCRAFVNKFVAFEFGKEVTFQVSTEEDSDESTPAPVTDFLNEIWDNHNKKMELLTDLGQTKAVTGIGWLQVKYEKPEDLNDPFDEYPKGRIRLINMSPLTVFPEYDPHDQEKLVKLTVMYPVETQVPTLFSIRNKMKTKVYKMVWTNDEFLVTLGGEIQEKGANPYGFIPFVPFINYPIANKTTGASDIDDIIPLNVELNQKNSDISEIIDYHSAPITVVYGADIGTLERGANKMWGGLPTDARIENLTMNTDLNASTAYIADVKKAIHEVGCIPENALGDIGAISNTSGVALQIMNSPLLERTNVKRMYSTAGLQRVNKMIIFMGIFHGLFQKPAVDTKDLYSTEVVWKDPLPKDTLIEMQQLQQEMNMGIESRQGAMQRLGKDSKKVLETMAEDYEKHPEFYGQPKKEEITLNSGMTNGETPQEMKRKEMTGENKKTPVTEGKM